jgi:branched-chain amino acid transport system ATP-binding protein
VSSLAVDSAGPLLTLEDVTAGFGSNQVLHGITFSVARGEIAGVFGLNGAGKSVTMKTIAGLVPAWSGRITFDGTDITKVPVEQRVAMGMGHVPQGRQVFPALTVEENLRLGAFTSRRRDKSRWSGQLERVLAQFPILAERRTQMAGTMSGGQQASLAVARALVNEPTLILVDEPSAGLAPIVVQELFEILQQVAASGVTMVLVEQNVTFGLRLVQRAHLLQTGTVVHSDDVAHLDQDTLARHLGIGRMLGATTSTALRSRAATPHLRRRRSAPLKAAPSPVQPAAKKTAPAKRSAPVKKAAIVKKPVPVKKAATKAAPATRAGRR